MKNNLWLRTPSGGGAATIPKVRAFDPNKVQVWPAPGTTKDLTISETWQKLSDLWTNIPNDIKVAGILSDAIDEAIDVCISPVDPDAAGQKSYSLAAGALLNVGKVPTSGLATANVTVTGEVEVASNWKVGPVTTATITSSGSAAANACTISCAGFSEAEFFVDSVATGAPTLTAEVSMDGTNWYSAVAHYHAGSSALRISGGVVTSVAAGHRVFASCAGYAYARLRWSSAAATTVVISGRASGNPWVGATANVDSGGRLSVSNTITQAVHGAVAATTVAMAGGEGRSTDPTAVDSGDAVKLLCDLFGKLIVKPHALRGQTWKYSTPAGGILTATKTTLKALESGYIQCLVDLSVKNHSTTAVEVTVYSASTDTGDLAAESDVLWRGIVDGDGPVAGSVENFQIPRPTTASHAIVVHTTAAGVIEVNAAGYKTLG